MAENVEVNVRSQLMKIVADLEAIANEGKKVQQEFGKIADSTGESIKKQTKETETMLSKMRGFGRRVADQMKQDFRSLFSISALGEGLKLTDQFRGSIRETVNLSDMIRKLGGTFGIAQRDFGKFQATLVRGLGDIGMSSEVAARTLEGLADTPVRGEKALLEYSKTAGMLASIGRQQGREGDIAGSMSRVIQARGGDVNDVSQMKSLAEDVRRARKVTGKGPSELLKGMEDLFTGMSQDFRKKFSSRGLVNLAAAGQVAGPNATSFIQRFLSLSKTQRAGMEARGVGEVFGEGGINVKQVARLYAEAKKMGGGDARLGARAAIGAQSDEEAEGFLRLAESLQRVDEAQKAVSSSAGDLATDYQQSKTLGEAFRSSINRIKKMVAGPLSSLTQGGTDLLGRAGESDVGAAGVVAGGAGLAALLAGFGLRGVGKGLAGGIGGLGKAAAVESLTGKEVQPVYVVNAAEIGGGGVAGAAAAGGGMLGKAGKVLGGAGLAYGVGAGSAKAIESLGLGDGASQTAAVEGVAGKQVADAFASMLNLLAKANNTMFGTNYGQVDREQVVKVEVNETLKKTPAPSRGGSF